MFSANSSQVSDEKLYVEDVFSTWLYTGNGSSQTITNGIDLSGKGGLVWIKRRDSASYQALFDTARGFNKLLQSHSSAGQSDFGSSALSGFTSSGFSVGSDSGVNGSSGTFASWSFRKAPKFFDVVTYTGNGANRNIAHNLGVAPGCIIVKRTDAPANWQVYHRSNDNTEYMVLNSTAAKTTGTTRWNSTTPTATEFTVGTDTTVNASGGTYVAYLFAHDATSDGVIQCGSLTFPTGGSQVEVNLGWEPQWLLVKSADTTDNWYVFDNMRGMGASNVFKDLRANTTAAEADLGNATYPDNITSTGFSLNGGFFGVGTNTKFIYIAIRRGPMKTPTLGTSVFSPFVETTSTNPQTVTTNFPVDLSISVNRTGSPNNKYVVDRLRGSSVSSVKSLLTNSTNAEFTSSGLGFDSNVGLIDNGWWNTNGATFWSFRRAPSFFDEVCYKGTSVAGQTISHNLGVVPELIIVKSRSAASNWEVLASNVPCRLNLNTTGAGNTPPTAIIFGDDTTYVAPTSSYFVVGTGGAVNSSARTYVAYLFASCPGVSKVTNFTGTGALQTINCGFASGARFVLIKRTDAAGDWYIYDSSRGISSANDPYLLLNSTAAEVTSTNWVDTDASGFKLTAAAGNNVNINGASYIALAIS